MGKEYRFIPDAWISFTYEGKSCVGRTFTLYGIEIVGAVGKDGEIGHIPFDKIENPKQLRFIDNSDKLNQNVVSLSKIKIEDFNINSKTKMSKSKELLIPLFNN